MTPEELCDLVVADLTEELLRCIGRRTLCSMLSDLEDAWSVHAEAGDSLSNRLSNFMDAIEAKFKVYDKEEK